ncbi:DUF6575 domain-containing protein [Liquorilactobacillus nagelii]|uniref:DUF6575 domain-containing protein n=1 Tax=Liquorilactobacillus nagelii TaxID=82688 RepID=UPI0006EFACB6|nr:DUF6575 domain-containing protein [Liquorilactobacillus nagelii]KRL39932.1 hypothetical protein FD45_GL000108 [Liquorilactobacillus nagelii DSM 13675]QYH53450.1 hypothetical protein G6O73_01555 [Liquorilactobacillus nagelii DSM 13675]
MNKLSNSPIKKFKIYHVYDYYDEPILYSFLNETGALFLANFVDYDEDSTETWLYLPVSFQELKKVESGECSLRTLILSGESSFAYIEKQKDEISNFFIESTSNIDSSYLPEENVYIEYQTDQLIESNSTDNKITPDNRYAIDISFTSDKNQYEMSASLLSGVLVNLQRIMTALTLDKKAKRIYKIHNELNIVGTFAGSFGIRLLSDKVSSLLNENESEPYRKIVSLFKMTNQKEIDVEKIVKDYGWLTLKHFLSLSKNLLDLKGGKIESGIPLPGAGVERINTTFESNKVNNFMSLLSKSAVKVSRETETLQGTLTKYDFVKHQFSFTSDKDKAFNGIVKTEKSTYTIPAVGKAVLSVEITEDRLNETTQKKISLVSWTPQK